MVKKLCGEMVDVVDKQGWCVCLRRRWFVIEKSAERLWRGGGC